jgi:dTDP-4-amino-4,6-dideoxygalactose transaminase
MKRFQKSFLKQESLPQRSIEWVTEVMTSGRLHRYDIDGGDPGHAALLEQEFGVYQGSRFCLAVASCGYALYIAMLAAGVKPGDGVLCNAFTLAPVPGAIDNCGAKPILVETTPDLTLDLDDLRAKIGQARFLLLSHMRGHLSDMDAICDICAEGGITLIEDCAHSLGAWWGDKRSGGFGEVSCFSTQSYKHLNSGEGGLLVTDNEGIIAKAILLSGSYMLFDRHLAAPDKDQMAKFGTMTPNYSGRMDNMRAAALRAQIPDLDMNCARWNERYEVLSKGLQAIKGVRLPKRFDEERYVGSSIQFFLPDHSKDQITAMVQGCAEQGIELKYFGYDEPRGYTSRFDSWHYLHQRVQPETLPSTIRTLSTLLDMRVPLTFDLEDCYLIVEIIADVLSQKYV